ncbi:MAG: ABC transporter ATP-binding protein [Clostridia bacterium]|nr:ABC transporter ATP-binding protein [Clostridia bacterium]
MDMIVKKLSKSYGDVKVLEDFDAVFPEGKCTAIMGKSGSGKTTLLNCIAGLTKYDGEIEGAGGVAYVFQEDMLVPHLTVYGNLALTTKGERRDERIKDILRAVEMTEKATAYPEELSGGEKKRVALCRAFLSEAETVLLDEPTNSLDLGLKIKTYKVFLELIGRYGKTAIYVTHDIDEALSVSDAICVISCKGIIFKHEFSDDKAARDVTAGECVAVRRDLMAVLT